jgi:SAM-dependent methyltransferase
VLIHTRCPIDGSDDADVEVYPASFDPADVSPQLFSARRAPDRLHYRMVRNRRTGSLRADPILDERTVASLYERSSVTYADVASYAVDTYMDLAQWIWAALPDRRGVLEIGCGHGLFLERMARMNFDRVAGVEPSADAVAKADASVRDRIHLGMMKPGLFPPEVFSLVCGFQVLDHLADPNGVLRACWDSLAPGGITYWVCHDIGSPLAKVLGRRCPMVDIEHVVLYNRATMAALFRNNGFEVLRVFGVSNSYPLDYWVHIGPFPGTVKRAIRRGLAWVGVGRMKIHMNAGNMGIVARKPAT